MVEEIREIKIEDKNYPELLKQIKDAPKILYYKGELKEKPARNASGIADAGGENCLAVVGTRRCSSYGKQATIDLVIRLIESGLTIVSGLAPGIDTIAHQTCVERKKRTIAVLGTGLDEKSIYPQTNIGLAREILKNNGCLISELPPGTPGAKFTFPKRNRIISGLSLGTLVVEAKNKSGSLITADYAFKQNRKVFAVPGPISSSNSAGPHKLIKRGAKLVDNPNDILQELNLPIVKNSENGQEEFESPEELLIYQTLKEESLYIDKIIEKTKLNASLVATTIALMEISGKIRNLGGNTYSLN